MVLCWKTVDCPLQALGELLPQTKELKYLRVLFMSDRKMELEMDRWFDSASAVMQVFYWTVVVKRVLCQEAKLQFTR